MSEGSSSLRAWALTAYVSVIAVLAVILAAALWYCYPPGVFTPWRWAGLALAFVVLHILNQLNFTIRFSGQPDNVELTFTEAALVALFFNFGPSAIVLLSGLAHLVREIQAHRRRRIQLVFNTSEIMVSVALAGFVYKLVTEHVGDAYIVAAFVAAMLTHSVANRLLVGTVISLNAGKFHSRYYKSLFVENVVMLFMNLALGMTAVMAFLLDRPYMLWVPMGILGIVYVAYQAYIGQLRDSNTLARLYENALLTSTTSEASLISIALSRVLDTFTSREVRLSMAGGPDTTVAWSLVQDQAAPTMSRNGGSIRTLGGADGPLLLRTSEPEHARAWRQGARYNGMAAPVQFEGKLMGVLHAEKPRAWDAFTQGDLRAFALFARQFGVALENARLMELDREQQRIRQRALDAERNRISRDLHDSFVQTLVHVDLHLAYLLGLVKKRPENVEGELDDLQQNVRAGLKEARSYMAELKPLRIEPGQFISVTKRYLEEFAKQHHLAAVVDGDETSLDLTGDDVTELFQIVREALNNVAKHAQAKLVRVSVESNGSHTIVRVLDNGVGFDCAKIEEFRVGGHYGLANICERANGIGAIVDWTSIPGEGTTLSVMIPRRTPTDVLKGVTA